MGKYGWRGVVFQEAETDELELHNPVVVGVVEDVCHCEKHGGVFRFDATLPDANGVAPSMASKHIMLKLCRRTRQGKAQGLAWRGSPGTERCKHGTKNT
jgi:hypothetical protein